MALPNNIAGYILVPGPDTGFGTTAPYFESRYAGKEQQTVVVSEASADSFFEAQRAGTDSTAVVYAESVSVAQFDVQVASVAHGLPVSADPLDFTPSKSGAQILLTFAVALRSLAATTVAGNYTVTGPSSITVTSVVFTPGNAYLELNYTGTLGAGTYTVTLAASTVQALATVATNTLVGQALVIAGAGGSRFNTGFN